MNDTFMLALYECPVQGHQKLSASERRGMSVFTTWHIYYAKQTNNMPDNE